jgi:L-aspartate oxidase
VEQIRRTSFTHVFLDVRHLDADKFAARFPGLMRLLGQFEIDPAKDPIPIQPSAHYFIGGVNADEHGQTSVPGLFAVGECSCSGLHGANRLASNSLLEGLAFGHRAGSRAAALAEAEQAEYPQRLRHDVPSSNRTELDVADVRSSLRSIMWRNVGIERGGERLAETREIIAFWSRYVMDKSFDPANGGGAASAVAGWELQNMLTICFLISSAAYTRTESRGVHYRTDFPDRDDVHWRMRLRWQRPHETPTPEPVQTGIQP